MRSGSWRSPRRNRREPDYRPTAQLKQSSGAESLEPFHIVRLQLEVEYGEIVAHVSFAGRPRQRDHADVQSESEGKLFDGAPVPFGDSNEIRPRQYQPISSK